METTEFSFCSSFEIGISVVDGEGIRKGFEGYEFGRHRFSLSIRPGVGRD
jgi:hypothetical protein